MEHYDQVQRSYDELVASGDIHNVPGPAGAEQDAAIDEQKAYMTRRAAYYLNLIDSDYGLLSKTTGTQVQGLSTDITIKKSNGEWYDIATDVEIGGGVRAVRPVNAGINIDASLISRWVQPTKEMAGLSNGNGGGTIPPVDEINAKLDEIIKNQALYTQAIINIMTTMQDYHTTEMAAIKAAYNAALASKTIVFPNYNRQGGIFGASMTPNPPKTSTE